MLNKKLLIVSIFVLVFGFFVANNVLAQTKAPVSCIGVKCSAGQVCLGGHCVFQDIRLKDSSPLPVTFSWGGVSRANKYELDIYSPKTVSVFNTLIVENKYDLDINSVSVLSSLSENSIVDWCVRGLIVSGETVVKRGPQACSTFKIPASEELTAPGELNAQSQSQASNFLDKAGIMLTPDQGAKILNENGIIAPQKGGLFSWLGLGIGKTGPEKTISLFQQQMGLPATGEMDSATQEAILNASKPTASTQEGTITIDSTAGTITVDTGAGVGNLTNRAELECTATYTEDTGVFANWKCGDMIGGLNSKPTQLDACTTAGGMMVDGKCMKAD